MKKIFLFLIFFSCQNTNVENISIGLPKVYLADILSYFEIQSYTSNKHEKTLLFFKKSQKHPINWVSVTEEDLMDAKIFSVDDRQLLVMRNPGKSNTLIFQKIYSQLIYAYYEYPILLDSIYISSISMTANPICFETTNELGKDRRYYFLKNQIGITTQNMYLSTIEFDSLTANIRVEMNDGGTKLLQFTLGIDTVISFSHDQQLIFYPLDPVDFDSIALGEW